MSHLRRSKFILAAAFVTAIAASQAHAQIAPNPYRLADGWAKLPEGRTWGNAGAVDVDRNGHVWVFERCGGTRCTDSKLDPILQFDPSGKLLRSFGAGLFVFPHGIGLDNEGNVYVTDGEGAAGKGHTVYKFSPEGKLLLSLGKPGVAGSGPDTFNRPSDVAIAANGDIFVADGHGGDSNARVVKFSKEGKFIKAWGKKGSGAGEFDEPHSIAIDSQGRVFVADRGNNQRIQIFDAEGNFITEWKHFGRPSGLFIDANDTLYVGDTLTGGKRIAGKTDGIWVASAKDGKVIAFIPEPGLTADASDSPEGVAADAMGNIYGAETNARNLRKYVRSR